MTRSVWILDLDGVVWLGDQAIAGSADAVNRLRGAAKRVLFLTNNAGPEMAHLVAKLGSFGIESTPADIVTSAQAAAGLVDPGSTVLVCAGPGVVEALKQRGVQTVRRGDADAVIVGFHRDFDYDRLTAAFLAVHHGARLIGTNDDPTYPMPDGPVPGGGALLAAVATAAGVVPELAGKPYAPMAAEVLARIGALAPGDAVLVGDRPSTDGLMAQRLGVPFALVLSGVSGADDASSAQMVAPDLATLLDQERLDQERLDQETA